MNKRVMAVTLMFMAIVLWICIIAELNASERKYDGIVDPEVMINTWESSILAVLPNGIVHVAFTDGKMNVQAIMQPTAQTGNYFLVAYAYKLGEIIYVFEVDADGNYRQTSPKLDKI